MMLPLGIDRISALPDEMLIHILSFLPTKSAFATTVLSKRWTPLFHSLTAVYFDDEGVEDEKTCGRFIRFVDTILRVQQQPIKTFHLMLTRFELCKDLRFNVNRWVKAANQRGVENIELSTSRCAARLFFSFFTSQTLVVLKLNRFYMGSHDFESIDLPSLKILQLIDTEFLQKEDFKKLLSGCPILVDLYARVKFLSDRNNDNPGYKTMPKLEKACITQLDVPFTVIYNVEFLRIEQMERRYKDKYINSYYRGMPDFQNLISIELTFASFHGWVDVVEVLPYCPKLQSLAIEKGDEYVQFYQKWAHAKEPVPECVSLHLTTCSIKNFDSWDDFEFAEFILQNARFLQAMELCSALSVEENEKQLFLKQFSRSPRLSPTCKIYLDTEEINQQEHEKVIRAA
ncbi:F-box/FBD/LRR-repeat protein At5g56420-like [Lotus japonicus]|uniref:F-box/FBD/LRR-repeat protein At5g56420-like n=1 Tax=Lotus japonicus TaxID=34305 RepID=UPI00258BC3C7|nr:F-box/FBD/LRR-repeat protein At5g56420-like [Lotus japonicus]